MGNKRAVYIWCFAVLLCVVASFQDTAARRKLTRASLSDTTLIRVMSFNMAVSGTFSDGWRNRREGCVAMINAERPDILATQEGKKGQLSYIDFHTEGYARVGVARDNGGHKGEHCAIFYDAGRFRLIRNGDFWLSETPEKPSKGWDAANKRIVTWVCLHDRCSGRNVYVFNTHLDHKGRIAKEESVKLIARKIRETVPEDAILVVCGDMNTALCEDLLAPLREDMDCARTTAKESDEYFSFNAWGREKDMSTVDHIFIRNITPERFTTHVGDYGSGRFLSDHFPISAELVY